MTPNEILAILCILSFFAMLAIGIPVALTLAVSGLVFGYLGFGATLFNLLPARIRVFDRPLSATEVSNLGQTPGSPCTA